MVQVAMVESYQLLGRIPLRQAHHFQNAFRAALNGHNTVFVSSNGSGEVEMYAYPALDRADFARWRQVYETTRQALELQEGAGSRTVLRGPTHAQESRG